MFKVTLETEHEKCTVEIQDEGVNRDEALRLIEQALYGVGYRFDGILDFIEEA